MFALKGEQILHTFFFLYFLFSKLLMPHPDVAERYRHRLNCCCNCLCSCCCWWFIKNKKKLAFNFCRFCVIIRFFSSPPQRPMTSDFEEILSQILSITFFVLSLFLRKSQYFPFQCWMPNKGSTGTIFITSLVWRGPWLGIEPRTSRTRSQHYTTRLSRRRCWWFW